MSTDRETSWQALSDSAQALNAKIFALEQEMKTFTELVRSQSILYEKQPFNKLHNLDLPVFLIYDYMIVTTSLHQFRAHRNSGNIAGCRL